MPKNNNSIYQPMKYKRLYYAISLSFLIIGFYFLLKFGLKPAVDFTGGSNIVWQSEKLTESEIINSLKLKQITIRNLDNVDNTWTITTSPMSSASYGDFLKEMKETKEVEELTFTTVGPSLGKELILKTIYAIFVASTLILLYVGYRFKNIHFGAAAIIAMLHDTFILLGVFSFLGIYAAVEVDTLFVTAVLTILSFSVHDTIVVFDRIRELGKKHSYLDFEEVVNRAVVETLGRSINNSMTIIFMLLAMYLMGGESIKWFIFALLVGTVSGTYSSTFTAAPLLVSWHNWKSRKTK